MVDAPVAVVTGATGGIGLQVALGLAQIGWTVEMVGRDPARAATARALVASRAPDARIAVALADLASLAATRALAAGLLRRHARIHLLVNNAGVFSARRETTAEGHDRVLAVNHLAPFVLTGALLTALRPAGGPASRIVNIGSAMAASARTCDLEASLGRDRFGVLAYARSKLALMMASMTWAERLRGEAITVNVVHPGMVATDIARAGIAGLTWRLLRPLLLTAAQGAAAPLHVALAPDLAGVTGAFFDRQRRAEPPMLAGDAAACARLWEQTQRLVG